MTYHQAVVQETEGATGVILLASGSPPCVEGFAEPATRGSRIAKSLLRDELWALIEPLLPPVPARPKGGRPRVPDRAALSGILLVLRTPISWKDLPHER